MRRLVLSCLLLCPLLLASQCPPPEDPARWYLVAGQSNAVGASSQETPVGDGLAYQLQDDEAWPLQDPWVHLDTDEFRASAWPSFSLEVPGEVRLIATARGSSCLMDWPETGKSGRWDPETGDLYPQALARWRELGEPVLRAVLWYQGECDAQQAHVLDLDPALTHALYRAALFNLANAVSEDFRAPLVAAPISLRWCAWENADCDPAEFRVSAPKSVPVHDATVDAAAIHPWILPGPSSNDLRMMPDNAHVWDVNELGRRWAAVVP